MEIGRIPYISAQTQATQPKTSTQQAQNKSTAYAADTDKFVPSEAGYSPAYAKGNSAKANAQSDLGLDANASVKQIKNNALKSLVQETLSHQANKAQTGFAPAKYQPLLGQFKEVHTALAAAEKTSEKYADYWGVDATAERIFTFAKNLAGSDDSLFQTMKDAFNKGFDAALSARRGKLPDISYQTKNKVLEHFDNWEKEIAAKTPTASTAPATTETTTAATPKKNETAPDANGKVSVNGGKGTYYKANLYPDEKKAEKA